MKRSKTKKKTKATVRKPAKKPASKAKRPAKQYSVHLLVVAVALLVTAESALILNATPQDWKAGVAILDVSRGMTSMVSDVKFAAEPIVFTFNAVNDFYAQSAVASAKLLDASDTAENSLTFVYGVNDFYQMASQQLASILDLSDYATRTPWQPQVAGVSITR